MDKAEIFLQENMGVDGETTWADHRITDDDIKYVRSDIVPKILTIEELRKQFINNTDWKIFDKASLHHYPKYLKEFGVWLKCARVNNLTKE